MLSHLNLWIRLNSGANSYLSVNITMPQPCNPSLLLPPNLLTLTTVVAIQLGMLPNFLSMLSPTADLADSFDDIPTSLMKVRKNPDDETAFIFVKNGITVHKELNSHIKCLGDPILIGMCNYHDCYQIPLIQQKGP